VYIPHLNTHTHSHADVSDIYRGCKSTELPKKKQGKCRLAALAQNRRPEQRDLERGPPQVVVLEAPPQQLVGLAALHQPVVALVVRPPLLGLEASALNPRPPRQQRVAASALAVRRLRPGVGVLEAAQQPHLRQAWALAARLVVGLAASL
jgi:hypothetical protein